jgi:hypothetical protein
MANPEHFAILKQGWEKQSEYKKAFEQLLKDLKGV